MPKTKINIRSHKRRIGRHRVYVRKHTRKIPIKQVILLTRRARQKNTKMYRDIAKRARKKGYNIPKINTKRRTKIKMEEVDIPETFGVDGFTIPIEEAISRWGKKFAKRSNGKYYVGIDDDASLINRKKAIAHEYGHITMLQTNEKPHTEHKAEKRGADILDMPLKEFQKDIVFDQDFHKAGIQLPRKKKK